MLDEDTFLTFGDDQMSVSETIIVTQGEQNRLSHHSNLHSSDGSNGCVVYDYGMYPLSRAALSVKVRYARNLQDTDPVWNSPDPYVIVDATSSEGSHSKQTCYIDGTENPTWNSDLYFGC